jgi:hypothetical protein
VKLAAPDVRRRFWAMFLDSAVQSDGQVPGFSAWWDRADDHQRRAAQRYASSAALKIERDHRDPDECLAAGVSALRDWMRYYLPPQSVAPPPPEEVRELMTILAKRLGWPSRPAPTAGENRLALEPLIGDPLAQGG